MTAIIRPFRSDDLDALYAVCVRTADNGDDLTGAIVDAALPGHLYAGPYGVLEPQSAWVVQGDEGVGGYIVGAMDTSAFEIRLEAEWFPDLRAKYPEGSGGGTLDNRFIALIHHPVTQDSAIVADYPAHLHIDLLPRMQGQGLGRQLIATFCDAMQGRGAIGVHLGVNPLNHGALAFYARVGFEEVANDGTSVLFGRRLSERQRDNLSPSV